MTEPQRLKIGDGIISEYLSVFLAIVSFGAVLCAYFPEYLTTEDFRKFYDLRTLKWIVLGCVAVSFLFALTGFLLNKRTTAGLISILLNAVSVLLGSLLPESVVVGDSPVSIGLDWLLIDILVSVIIFIPIELFLPQRPEQSKFHSEWKTDLVYFIFGHLFVQSIGVLIQLPSVLLFRDLGLSEIHTFVQSIPFFLQLILALFISDLFQYAAHRTFHAIPFLWRFHAVHHSIRNIDWLAGSRLHLVDIIGVRSFSYLPLYVCGFSYPVFAAYIVIVSLQAVFAHANTRINFGWLKYIVVTPQYHHWHHADDRAAYDKNFAIHFPFIDMLFGTYFPIGNRWPERTGLNDARFPKGFFRQMIHPFRRDPSDGESIEDPSIR